VRTRNRPCGRLTSEKIKKFRWGKLGTREQINEG